jgi:hypothetical protein
MRIETQATQFSFSWKNETEEATELIVHVKKERVRLAFLQNLGFKKNLKRKFTS